MIYLDLGRREQGKTTLAYYIVTQLPKRMIFDPRGMVRGEASEVATDALQWRELTDAFEADQLHEIVYTPSGNMDVAFDDFCREARRFVRAHPREQFGMLIDEIRFVLDGRSPVNENLDWVLRCAPVNASHIILTGHRPKDVPTDIRGIADKWLLFQFTLPRDTDIIEEFSSSAVAAGVKRLERYQFIEWDDRIGKMTWHTNPRLWNIKIREAADANVVDVFKGHDSTPPVDKAKLFS